MLKGIFKMRIATALLVSTIVLSGCSKGGDDFGFADGSSSGNTECAITTSTPESNEVKVAASGGTSTQFSVGLSSTKCTVSFALNGVPVTGTGVSREILSSALVTGANTLVATSGTTTKTWTIAKNTAPSCASQTPAATGNAMGPGGTLLLTGSAGDADGDALSLNWTVNDATVATSVLNPLIGLSSSNATFQPTGAFLGVNSIKMNISDGLDTTSCAWTVGVAGSCTITSTTPTAPGPTRVAYASSTNTNFQIGTDAGCLITWELNGSTLGATSNLITLSSNDLMIGSNILEASVTNGTSTSTVNWAVVRNSPPQCSSQTPGSTGNNIGVGATINLTANGSDLNADALTFTWKNNGVAVDTSVFTILTGVNTSQVNFAPTASYVGINTVRAEISDGYDSVPCTWTVNVVPQCSVVSSTPSAGTVRVANSGSATTSFVAVPNDSSCAVSWTLNGSPLGGSTAIQNLASSVFSSSPASNTLVATLSNGYSTATRTWTVNRNAVPTCDTQLPAPGTSTVGVGGTIILRASGADTESDPLTYSWRNNGVAINPLHFATSVTAGVAQAIFTPNSGYVGVNTVAADISDGMDSASCTWSVNVINTCLVSSSLPSGASSKIAYAPSTANAFGIVPSDAACNVSWNLNGSPVPGGAFITVNSSDFSDGPTANTLIATLDNGYTAPTTRSWTINKNRLPLCSSQTPVANPPAQTYGTTQNFIANVSDPDGDSISSFSWTFNGATSGSLFTPITNTATQSSTTFRPTLTNVGTGHAIACAFSDGYDTGSCAWTMDVNDPNTVTITSCSPSSDPVVLASAGPSSSQTLTANATGNGLTYSWYKNAVIQPGFSTPNYAISSGALPTGIYTFKATVTDAYSNSDDCDWNVKVNAPPVISSPLPSPSQSYRVNYQSAIGFSVSASDGNSDPMTYQWTLDGVLNAALPTGSASTTFSPAGNFGLLGSHTVTVTVSDGTETASQSWTVEVNLFTDACNTMMNTSVATAGGNICTLVGLPTIGNGNIPGNDQTLMRIRPSYVTDDGSGNIIFTDQLNNTVNFFNRSGSNITRFGRTIPAGQMVIIMGNGANGLTQDSLYRTDFKLNLPMDLAYDAAEARLYVADYSNHRVAMMDNSGLVTTVVGIIGSATNNAANNTDGNPGYQHVCGAPTGVHLVNYGGSKWLYVACSSTHSIKRMNADVASVNFGKTYVVVGRVNGAGATLQGATDGPIGQAGDATVNEPWALSDDGNGNVYWTESSGTYRVRMATTGGSALDFFTNAYTPSNAFSITASDVAGALTAGSFTTQAVAVSGAATQVTVEGPSSGITNACVPYRVRILNASNNVTNLSGANTILLAGAGAGGAFYSDAGCTAGLTGGNQVSMSSGQSFGDFYYKKTSTGSVTFSATGTGLTAFPVSGGLAVAINASGAPGALSVRGSATYDYTQCMRFTVQVQTAGGQASLAGSTRTIRMSNNATGNFYTDSACSTTPQVQFTIAAGQSEIYVYFARTVRAPAANYAVSLFGNANNNGASPGSSYPSANVPANVGLVTLRYPRGLAVYAPGGTLQGFFVNNWDNHRTIFVNATAATSLTFGGATAGGNQGVVVLGTGSGAFNTDGLGSASRVQTGYGLDLNPAQNTLIYPDYDNYRLRTFDLSVNNGDITTIVGAGRSRSGNLGDSPTPAPSMYLNSPSQVLVDNTNRKLYVSDSSNGRIRRVDLLTGYVDTVIGKGIGAANVENEDPTNVFMSGPRAMHLMTSGGVPVLLYADQAANTAGNTNCMVRAMNMSLTTDLGSFFGTSILKNRVSTLAGNYVLGCNAWATAPANSAGMNATDAKLYNPEGITSDGSNIYVASYNDHCVLRIDSTGKIYQHLGACGTAGTTDGNTTVATLNLPTAVFVDPSYSADGNLFVVDAPNNNPSRVRYVNYRTSSVTIAGSTIPAAPGGGVGIVQTLWTVSPSGNSSGRLFGFAAFSNQICFSGGAPTNGGVGSHNVTCYDRSSVLGAVTLRVGPNEATGVPTRGGAPIDLTQENIYSGSALVNAPYGLAFDSSGNLYISERNNHIVRLVRRWW